MACATTLKIAPDSALGAGGRLICPAAHATASGGGGAPSQHRCCTSTGTACPSQACLHAPEDTRAWMLDCEFSRVKNECDVQAGVGICIKQV